VKKFGGHCIAKHTKLLSYLIERVISGKTGCTGFSYA